MFGGGGRCYRTGGDEFVVLTNMDREACENAIRQLELETGRWHGTAVKSLSAAAGYALAGDFDDKSMTAEGLVSESDKMMYNAKASYYQNSGRDRRKRR